MSLINKSGSGKNLYTLEEDIIIVMKRNEGSTVTEIAAALDGLGFHRSPESLQYRIGRKLSQTDSFEALHKTDTKTVEAALAKVDALLNPIEDAPTEGPTDATSESDPIEGEDISTDESSDESSRR